MIRSRLWLVVSALVGAGAALVTTTTVRGTEEHDQQGRADQSPSLEQADRSTVSRAHPARLRALEQEIARLRDDRRGRDAPPLSTEASSPEEERGRLEARFAELERRLLADPVDPSWSSGAASSLRDDLDAIAGRDGFELVAVECRTEICRATLRWDKYETAVRTGSHLPERAIPGLNCLKSIWLREPGNPSEAYSSDLYLECSEQRAGKVDVIQPQR